MSASIIHRPASGLMARCALLLSLVPLPGCTMYERVFGDPDQYSHQPAMVMFVDDRDMTKDGASLTIEMNKIHIGAVAVTDILKGARDWRLNVFTLSGTHLAGNDNYNTEVAITLQDLPVGKMMIADLDTHKEAGPDAEVLTKSFLVLLHKYPE